MYCINNHRNDWTLRLGEEANQSEYPVLFITLTYANHSLPWTLDDHPIIRKHYGEELDEVTLLTRDVQLFNKLVRQNNKFHTPAQYRYYAAGEYGSLHGRPHYHLIVFNLHPKTVQNLHTYWKHGTIDVQLCNSHDKVAQYVSGYIINAHAHAQRINKKPFSIMSKRPYLGHTYVARMYDYHKKNQIPYIDRITYKQRLPRIFKNKIFEQYELNAFKQPAVAQSALALANELHRLRLLNGPDWDGFNYLEKQKIYHEIALREKAKHTDKYQYHFGPLRKNPFK